MTGSLHAGLLSPVLGLLVLIPTSCAHPENTRAAYPQETLANAQRTVWDGVYSEAQAERGRVLYAEACSGCHAPDLRGNNTSPSLVGVSFMFLWGGSTLGVLSERIRDRMPPTAPGTLSAQTYRDILAFVLLENTYPSGEQELEDDDLHYIIIGAKTDPVR